jgi:hypothetical protein
VNDLKVEVPLNQAPSTPAKKVKSVSFSEMLHKYIPLTRTTTAEAEDEAMDSQVSFDAFFDQVIQPLAGEANQNIEQEQLQEADSLLRVTVPILNFDQPTVPWKIYARKANGKCPEGETELMSQRKLLSLVKHSGLTLFSPWRSAMKLERQLHWTAIPRELANVGSDEKIDDAPYLAVILDDMGLEDVVVSDSLTWKPDGLRLLDDLYESESELEPADFQEEESKGMDSLWKKRTSETAGLDASCDHEPPQKRQEPTISVTSCKGATHRSVLIATTTTNKTNDTQSESNIFGGGMFSASTALSNFMRSQGKLPTTSKTTSTLVLPTETVPTFACTSLSTVHLQNYDAFTAVTTPENDKKLLYTTPIISHNLDPRSFIISTALLRNQRSLMRIVGDLYTNAVYFERDFSALPTAAEADLILSPTTGIVLTTLQKIKQRALPGQEAKGAGLQKRLSALSVRYERVILLVHEGVAANGIPRDLDQRDCDALAELKGFARSLEADTQVVYVPGGDAELGRYTVSYMLRYGNLRDENELQQEDSLVNSDSIFCSSFCTTDSHTVGTNPTPRWIQLLRCSSYPCTSGQ